jgi:FlaA1/EpsC-like NDP-sugar epimerase/lipopolysaccharide/colanic/teichoic acid biosynthesis glycosyltransferase
MAIVLKSRKQAFQLNLINSIFIRSFDLIAAGLGLIILAPLFGLIMLAIKLTSPGPVFYRAQRVGQYGRLFKLYKFRSMVQGADQQGPGITVGHDPRITPLGRWLRNLKVDELPQLLNILRGEMSLVGPRPEDPRYIALYTREQGQVLNVRPGITSQASVYYREEETLLSGDNWETIYREQILPRKLAAELAYLQRRTFWTDLGLILQTIAAIINGGKRLDSLLALRNRHYFLLDALALCLTPALALSLRLDGFDWSRQAGQALLFYMLVALLVKLTVFYGLGLYRRYWHYANVNDILHVAGAVTLATLILTSLFIGLHAYLASINLAMSRSVPLIDGLLTGLVVAGGRFGLRMLYSRRHDRAILAGRPVLIVGAGEAGILVVRELRANPQLDLEPLGFVDDDPQKIGTQVQGLPVLGSTADLSGLVAQYHIQRLVLAVPSLPLERQQALLERCRQTQIATYSLPGVYELLAGYKTVKSIPDIDLNRLLRRDPVVIDQTEVAIALHEATVLITGAGGSIGSELCRQIARFKPAKIILLGRGENSIFEIGLNLRLSFPELVTHQVIVDVRDAARVNQVVEKYRPQVIFHAAAHKHVPFMEENVEEAIINNVMGTHNVLRAAEQNGVERFVLISSDKAINPTSIMGATKRIAELLTQAAAQRSGRAYMAVRFGNVLGSRGSVVPIFQQQIAAGGPLTLTHADMTRYFMTIPEAVQLVLQATVLGQGSEIFVLDMGWPVRILDLATDLIKMSGLEPGRDIRLVYQGVRPGEKLSEELFLESEACRRTRHEKIFVTAQTDPLAAENLEQAVTELVSLAQQMQPQAVLKRIQTILPESQLHPPLAQPLLKPEFTLAETFFAQASTSTI